MDRNVVTATILIALIMVVWLTWLSPPVAVPPPQSSDSTQVGSDQGVLLDEESADPDPAPIGSFSENVLSREQVAADSLVAGAEVGEERDIVVESALYRAILSTKGGTIRSFELHEYLNALDSTDVQLVDTTGAGALSLVFTTPGSRVYDTRSFFFESDVVGAGVIEIGDAQRTITMRSKVGDGAIVKRYTFSPDSYEVLLDVSMESSEQFLTPAGYEILWNGAIPFTELDHEKGIRPSGAFARSGGDVENVTLASETYDERTIRGDVDWVAVKSTYFTAAIIPDGPGRAAELIGERFGEISDPDVRLHYSAGLAMRPPDGADQFRLYLGPMELSRIRKYDADLYDMVDYGWDFFETVTRPLAKFVFVPMFNFMGGFLPNYGLVIIVFSLLVKGALYPLTKSSFTSMAKMRELQPRMEVIKAKHPDNPQKQQEAMMKMYKETGVNPLGGCLPMLLQYPIIIALWQFLPQAIEIRQQGFLWATDLSAPDVILNLPFDIPFYGDFVSGFTLLMGISMVFQMRLQATPSSGAQAKIFMYVFPVMIFVIFNKLAAGLNLYYLCYNVLSAAQQKLINRNLHNHPEELAPKKPAKAKRGSGKSSGGKRGRR